MGTSNKGQKPWVCNLFVEMLQMFTEVNEHLQFNYTSRLIQFAKQKVA